MTCTRPPYVLDSRERLSPPGTPRNSLWLLRCLSRERAFSRRPNRFGLIFYAALRTRCPRAFVLAASGHERGPVRPAALDGMRPLTPLSRIPLPLRAHVTFVRGLESSRVPLWFRATREGRKSEEPAKTTLATGPWRPMTADDPRRLPSAGTLRRIRWPLQPRSRDRRTAFGDVATAG